MSKINSAPQKHSRPTNPIKTLFRLIKYFGIDSESIKKAVQE